MNANDTAPKNKNSFTLTFDYRFVTIVLLVVIAAMLLLWRPWAFRADADTRTVDVTGEATLTATPDEFVFYPSYTFKNDDKDIALKELSAKSDEVVKKLKELGVPDNKIKSDSNGYDGRMYTIAPVPDEEGTTAYTLTLTVTVSDQAKAQKVQDYLVTTSPTGAVSPQASFSDKKRKELENKARDEATKDARAKAEQSAKNLGFKIGAVKSVNDDAGFGGVYPALKEGMARDMMSSEGLGLQPGENELTYRVTVVYYVK